MRIARWTALLALLPLADSATALDGQDAPEWICLSTPHFELYTTSDESLAVAALQHFEEVRSFFTRAAPFTSNLDSVVKVIAFRSESEYLAFLTSQSRPNPGAYAYYQHNWKGDFIVLQDLAPEHFPVAVHEYTHFVVVRSGLKLPLWLNEGIADLYSSVERWNGGTLVGRAPGGRLEILRTQAALDPKILFTAGVDSPYYSQPEKMRIFYAESWALAHMLAMSSEYSPQFTHFLRFISSGETAAHAFQAIYGKTLDQVAADLREYLSQRKLPAQLVDFDMAGDDVHPRARSAGTARAQAELVLADLASSKPVEEGAANIPQVR